MQWKSLYGARRRLRHAAFSLPELPNSMFGWIPIVYRITSEEVLASAGLDAYVVCLCSCHIMTMALEHNANNMRSSSRFMITPPSC